MPAAPEGSAPPSRGLSDLALRAMSGAVLAVVALGLTWLGGVPFVLLWLVAAVAVQAEWVRIVSGVWHPSGIVVGGLALAVAAILAQSGRYEVAVIVVLVGAVLVGAVLHTGREPFLAALGLPYASAALLPILALRQDPAFGVAAVLFVFAVVWGSDVMAYFTGRTFGGPKLWPRVSPKKTWSGFLGGTVSGGLLGLAVAAWAGAGALLPPLILGTVLAVVSQGGDLFESALKRRFGTKDASQLIPGHGGVMDRLDGFIAAALVAALVGAWRMPHAPAAGLLNWP